MSLREISYADVTVQGNTDNFSAAYGDHAHFYLHGSLGWGSGGKMKHSSLEIKGKSGSHVGESSSDSFFRFHRPIEDFNVDWSQSTNCVYSFSDLAYFEKFRWITASFEHKINPTSRMEYKP